MSSADVLLHTDGAVATISFNRPQAMNTYNLDLATAFDDCLSQVAADAAIRVVMLKGEGPLFMAGGDIQYFAKNIASMENTAKIIMTKLHHSIELLQTMAKPVLAVVHGSVAGVGLSIMLACDLVLAASDTKFTTAYSKLGLSPDGGASYFLPRVVGTKKAMELLMISELFGVEQAERLGLINWQIAPEQLTAHAQRILNNLAKAPTKALAACKQLVNQSMQHDLSQQTQLEEAHFIACSQSQDFATGVTAFLQKQVPDFRGK